MSRAKVELGRQLFYDPRLSIDGSTSCASCHRQELAFTDGRPRAVGATGELHPRSAMSLANVAYGVAFTWADPGLASLEAQVSQPLLNRQPVEMGLAGREREALARLKADDRTQARFARAFPDEPDRPTLSQVGRALASFERTLISGRSPYDRWLFEGEPLAPSARSGMRLFFSQRLACGLCHGGFNLSGPVTFEGAAAAVGPEFHDTNLPPGPEPDRGLAEATGRARDAWRFRAPTLRNVAVTAPYMHDGRLATLDDVLDHYAAGGRRRPVSEGRSSEVRGFVLSPAERRDLLAFLEALTDRAFLTDPRFGPPPSAEGPARTAGPGRP